MYKMTYEKYKKWIRLFLVLLMMFGIIFGAGLTASGEMFYNSLIMPFVGVLGYILFQWSALYLLPLLLLISHFGINFLKQLSGMEHLDVLSILVWTMIYSVFVAIGFIIAKLLHLVLKRGHKMIAFLVVLTLIVGVGVFANGLVGNPISKILAKRTAEKHLEENYGDTDFYVAQVSYDFKIGCYFAYVESESSIDSHFPLYINMLGKMERDDYENQVTSGWNTADRLNTAYRELVDTVIENPSFPEPCYLAYGDLGVFDKGDASEYRLKMENLELDQHYNIQELGAKAGRLIIYLDDETITVERAAERILEIKNLMDAGGAPFYAMDFVLQLPMPEDGTPRPHGQIEVTNFLYEDIYEEGMVERVKAAQK